MSQVEVKPLIDPRELASFDEAVKKVAGARSLIDRLPAELDESSEGAAADALKEAGHALDDVEISRRAEKTPYEVTGQSIDASFNELKSSLKAARESLKARVIAFTSRRREEAEKQRKREEENARKRQVREDAKAAAEGRASHDKRGAPAPPPPKPTVRGNFAKTTVKRVKKYAIEDESKLPDGFVKKTPDRRKIKAAVDVGLVVEGVRVWEEDEVATR